MERSAKLFSNFLNYIFMKKLLIAAVCFIAVISMSSCTEDSPIETQKENSITSKKPNIEKTADVSADGGDPTIPPIKK